MSIATFHTFGAIKAPNRPYAKPMHRAISTGIHFEMLEVNAGTYNRVPAPLYWGALTWFEPSLSTKHIPT